MQLQGCPNWQTTSTPGVNIFDGKAHLVTAVKSRDSVAFYIDGIHMPSAVSYCGSDPTAPVHSRFITTSNPYVIGYDSISGGTMSNYNGWISKARIWNVELSAAQVTANAGSVLSPQPGLVGYYLMRSKDTCTQAIADLSGYTSSTVTLDGSSSTGSISSYQWTKVSGPNNPVIVSPTAATTQVTGLISGIYAFQLSINGGSSTSQVSVYVNTAASANAAAGPNQSIFSPASSVTLNGSGSSGAITSYTWSLVSGPNSPIIVSPSSISTNVTGLIAGAYIFNLSLNGGASASQIKVYVLNTSTTSVFTTQTPASNSNAGMGIELGMRFRSKSAGYIKGVRFYKTTLNTGTHTGELYNNYGTRLAQATFTGETSSGWQTVLFSTPVYIKADTTYLAAYYSAAGNYSYTGGIFISSITNGVLTALADGTDGPNGVYSYSASSPVYPISYYNLNNYFVDPVFMTSSTLNADAGSDQAISQPATSVTLDGTNSMGSITSYSWTKVSGPNTPTITSASLAKTTVTGLIPGNYVFRLSLNGGTSTANVNVIVNAVSVPTANAGAGQTIVLPASTVTLNGSGSTGPISSYIWSLVSGPNTPVIVSPSSAVSNVTGLIQGNYLFQLAVNGGISNSQVNVNVLNLDTTYNIFTTQTTPTTNSNDGLAIEVGVKFRTSAKGYVKGVRFYKVSANTGTHIGELYDNYGNRLAQATFVSETTSGWQTVLFNTPVSISPNVTYMAAYFSGSGNYSSTPNYFTSAVVNGPVTALADGTDGVNGMYSYTGVPALPSNFYNKSNYWVDVLFATTKSGFAYAGTNQSVTMTSPAVSNAVRGGSLSSEFNDPVWLSASQISFTGPDPVGVASSCTVCQDTSHHNSPTMLCPDPPFVLPPLMPVAAAPCADSSGYAAQMSTYMYSIYRDSLKGSFDSAYIGKCLQVASKELLTFADSVSEYHYTLYYYDQAGNLVKTVPPKGVVRNYSSTWLSQVSTARQNGTLLSPAHTLATNYRYNTLNQNIQQNTPDAGIANFWYDRLGRLSLSQNAKQLAEGGNYSYTLYDPIGRITEVGQINSGVGGVATDTVKVVSKFNTWLANNTTNRYQITNTIYDLSAPSVITPWLIQNPSTLRNRVSYSTVTPGQKGSNPVYATYYNYDIAGNVVTLLQDYGNTGPMYASGQEYKRIDYQFDLISGKVNSVGYQLGKSDAFMHFYQYDAENRLTDVYTTADSITIEHEAHYDYYKHGPLGRELIGQNQVQGVDYAYTLQGWLKSVNGTILDSTKDMGHDGDPAVAARKYIGKDAYGYSLHYFDADYQAINGTSFLTGLKSKLGTSYRGLYNGNISSMAVNIGILNNSKLYNYEYDQLNRITALDVLNGTNTGLNTWTNGLTASNDYKEKVSYDANGNILTYIRHGFGSTPAMDSMTYNYNSGKNQLNYVADGVASGNYANDLDNQSSNNYTYDAIGNLTKDVQAGITTPMTWSVYGKLLSVTNASGAITYNYDASGNRIGKTVGSNITWYVRDAQGNVLATYTGTNTSMGLFEQDLYGSSRLGMVSPAPPLSGATTYLDATLNNGYLYSFGRGKKLFELTNHLGNVLATVSDKKYGTAYTSVPSQISFYTADVKTAQDYYPFGMQMPGRSYTALNSYRYGFNGKEMDNSINGNGVDYDYGARIYDARVGKFFSLDPLQKEYPMLTPYQFAGNNPIAGIDLDGKEFSWFMFEMLEKKIFGTEHLKNVREGFTDQAAKAVKESVDFVRDLKNNKNQSPVYGTFTTVTAGIPPGFKSQLPSENELAQQTIKTVVKDYGELIHKAANGDEKAIGALGFEAVLFFMPGGEEEKALTSIPRGFKSSEQFLQAGEEFAEALAKSNIKYERIGIRGSSVTGVSSKGGEFRWGGENPSDIDAFVVLKEDIPIKGGAKNPQFIHPDKLLKKYPELRAWSKKWSKILKREITPAAFKPVQK